MSHALNVSVILETTRLAFAGAWPFPQVIAELTKIGVERYMTDLIRLERTDYNAAGDTVTAPLPLADAPPIAQVWSVDGVIRAVRAAQQSALIYPEFLRQIMAAGCAFYWVFLDGRKVIYFSRNGEFHIENFPSRS